MSGGRAYTIIAVKHVVFKFALCAWVAGLGPGCVVRPRGLVALNAAAPTPAVDYGDLAAVLESVLDDDALIVPDALKQQAKRLDRQLARLAVTGPTATSDLLRTADDVLAYWYNARAAWSLKLIALADCPQRIRRTELLARPFRLDGREMTLAMIDGILAAEHDWRVLVASPGVLLQRAALPREPFEAGGIKAAIGRRVNEFVDDARRFVIDVSGQRILVPPVLWQFKDRLIDEYETKYGTTGAKFATALLPYLGGSALRRIQDTIGYAAVRAGRTGRVARKPDE